jgi:hypothetical protein
MNRWSLFVDIEGFYKIYPEHMSQALRPLCNLMEGIYNIVCAVCPDTPHRLFAHQIGDGFIVVSEFAERSPGRWRSETLVLTVLFFTFAYVTPNAL